MSYLHPMIVNDWWAWRKGQGKPARTSMLTQASKCENMKMDIQRKQLGSSNKIVKPIMTYIVEVS